jgi:hypothetical protein
MFLFISSARLLHDTVCPPVCHYVYIIFHFIVYQHVYELTGSSDRDIPTINLLKLTGYVMHYQFNIQQL